MRAAENPLLLAIDDDVDQLALIAIAGQKSGEWRVLTADSAEAAIRLLSARAIAGLPPPDLIMSDLVMPGTSGLEIFHLLRARPECEHVPIVMLTTSCYFQDREKAMQAGVAAFFQKSMRFTDLVGILRLLPAYLPEQHEVHQAEVEFAGRKSA